MLRDPRLLALADALVRRPARRLRRHPETREAAVALVLRAHDTLEVLLIKRAENEDDPWSGHMALPGGRRHPGDTDLVATAFRETAEETGVPLGTAGVLLGDLDEIEPRTRRLPPIVIAPVVAAVPPDTPAVPDPSEVDLAIWVPLPALQDPGAVSEVLIELEGLSRAFPCFRYEDFVIWGLTHRILEQFIEVAAEVGL